MTRIFTAYDKITAQVLYSGTADSPEALATDVVGIVLDVAHGPGFIDPDGYSQIPEKPGELFKFDFESREWLPIMTPTRQWDVVRKERGNRLIASDWTQLPDVPLATKEVWASYRQALRDITEQPDPFNITWPAVPG